MKSKLGLYAGSFSPFHVGHMDIVKQALNVFDKVLIAKGKNPEKAGQVERYPMPYSSFTPYIGPLMVVNFSGLLTDYIQLMEKEGYDVTLVRGLRNGADLEYEQNMLAFLKDMYPKIKVVAFYCDPKFRHISSSALRNIETIAPEEFKKYTIIE